MASVTSPPSLLLLVKIYNYLSRLDRLSSNIKIFGALVFSVILTAILLYNPAALIQKIQDGTVIGYFRGVRNGLILVGVRPPQANGGSVQPLIAAHSNSRHMRKALPLVPANLHL